MSDTMGESTAAVVWGIPVKTVDFLCHLDAFRKAIPTIHTLRLCNQFGRDDHAGITKLPKELIEIIEKELFASLCKKETRAADGWAKKYACFEGTCRTRDHIGKSDPKWYLSDDYADIRFELLHDHPEWWTGHRYKLPKNYPKLLEAELDNIGEYDLEEFWEVCYEKRHEWQSLVDEHMNNGGNKDFLRKHFGLDVFIMHENLDDDTIEYLDTTHTRYSNGDSPTQKATICYLVLPSRTAQWGTRLDADCIDNDYLCGESGSSMLVDRSSLDLTAEHQRRFARAMMRLALKPSVHPSQLQQNLSATPTLDDPTSPKNAPHSTSNKKNTKSSKKGNSKKDDATTRRIKNLEQSHWPKLMLLARQVVSEP